ncbi:MAG TPA: Npt1/Npt2 family nucleotide transporter [Gemmatimonadota bacterium]|nr:Npt1/Npt2 family nucleotide transporter [Gemmatimonadota bacterium]
MERILKRFVDVRKREVEPALLFFLFWFLVIVVFWVLRPMKVGLFIDPLGDRGAELELYAKLGNIGVAIVAVALFSWLYNRLGSKRLIPALCAIFLAGLVWFAITLPSPAAPGAPKYWAFYLFGDAWSTVWVTTFWAFLNEMTSTDQSKRLYGLIGGGGIIGGLVGATVVATTIEDLGIGTLIMGTAGATVILGLIAFRIETLARRDDIPIGRELAETRIVASTDKRANAALEGARLSFASKYLFAIVMIVFLYEFASQILDYLFKNELESVQGAEETSAFYANIGVIINTVSVITQFFLVSFIMRRFGITTALLVLPAAMMISSGIYFAVPALWAGSLLTISDNSLNYSINQTSRETLYVPTEADVKYKARAFANMFVQRFGKGIAILMALGLTAVPIRFLTFLAVGVIVIWAGFAWYAGRRFDEQTSEEPEPTVRLRTA